MLRILLSAVRESLRLENGVRSWVSKRGIAVSTSQCAKKMPDRPKPLNEHEFTEAFLKGSGPGGQKIVSKANRTHELSSKLLVTMSAS